MQLFGKPVETVDRTLLPLNLSRRELLRQSAGAALLGCFSSLSASEQNSEVRPQIGFSLYGMKSLSISEGLRICSEIGYECVELAVMPDWPSAPEKLTSDGRRDLQKQLVDRKLTLAAIMENLPLAVDGEAHQRNLDRLKRAAELTHDLAPKQTPLIETILGGSPDKWPMLKEKFIERLRDWAKVAEASDSVITIKAHVAGALHLPSDAAELVRQVGSKNLRMAFDQSHFQLRGLAMADAWAAAAEFTRFVHVKDARGEAKSFQFLLPGDGGTDYVQLFRLLKASRYAGPVIVEVSGQLFSKPDYDPLAAAKKCWPVLRNARTAANS